MGCTSCPLSETVMDRCQHPDARGRTITIASRVETPDWCPLREGALLVRLGGARA